MIGPSNRILIVLLLVGLILSFVRADAQEGSKKGAPNPYLKGTEGYDKGPRGLTSYQPVAIDQPFAAIMAHDVAAKPDIEREHQALLDERYDLSDRPALEGLKYVDIPAPEAPGPNQVLIRVEFSPLNQSDLLLARGIYATHPALPTVIGNEGVGRVLAVGPRVGNVKVGDRILAPLSSFTWRERMVVSANGLFALPPDADSQQLAMLAINPPTAALLLLSEYVNLKAGDWVVQNSANSGVGRWVIALAKTRGLKTVNIVRRPELVTELKAIGGDVVVVDSHDVSREIKAAVGQAELRLALDGVSGPATGVIAATLSPHGTLVSYAAMSLGPMSISPLEVIFKPLTVRGFWLGHPESAAKSAPAVKQAAEMIASGRVHIPVVATYALSSIKEAVAHAQRGGKILLEVAGSST